MNNCPTIFFDFRIFAPLCNDAGGKSHCRKTDTSEKKHIVVMTKTIRTRFLRQLKMYPNIASSRSQSPPPAELGEVGASEAKLREGGFALQVCHLTIAALGPHPNVA